METERVSQGGWGSSYSLRNNFSNLKSHKNLLEKEITFDRDENSSQICPLASRPARFLATDVGLPSMFGKDQPANHATVLSLHVCVGEAEEINVLTSRLLHCKCLPIYLTVPWLTSVSSEYNSYPSLQSPCVCTCNITC